MLISMTTLVGCAKSIKLVYAPKAGNVSEPGETFRRLVMTSGWARPVKIDVEKSYAAMHFVGSGYVRTITLSWDQVADVILWRKEGKADFWVDLMDAGGTRVFTYFAPNQKSAEEFVDVVEWFRKSNK